MVYFGAYPPNVKVCAGVDRRVAETRIRLDHQQNHGGVRRVQQVRSAEGKVVLPSTALPEEEGSDHQREERG